MLQAAPDPVPFGMPIDGLDFGDIQFRYGVTDELVMTSGISTIVAHLVAESSGDLIRWPFHTLGFVDAQSRTLATVIHCGAGVPGEAEMSISHERLPLTRRVLQLLAVRLFLDAGLTSVTVRVRLDDDRLQAVLSRFGFVPAGQDDRLGRLLLTLSAEAGFRRAFPRGLAPHGRAS